MATNVGRELADLKQVSVRELREKYETVFGEPTRAGNKDWLFKRIAWRIQALAEGDLSERARQRADFLARDADLRTTAPRDADLRTTAPRDPDVAQVGHRGNAWLPRDSVRNAKPAPSLDDLWPLAAESERSIQRSSRYGRGRTGSLSSPRPTLPR